MGVDVAVSPSVRTPGLHLLLNLLAGPSSPGSTQKRGLVICPKTSAGTITEDTQIAESVGGSDEMKTLLGAGIGNLVGDKIFDEHGIAAIDVVAPAASAGSSASQTVTFSGGPPAVTWDVTIKVAGRTKSFQWLAGQSDTLGGDALVAAIPSSWPVTAVNVAGVVTLEFKATGLWGNDCTISVTYKNGSGGTVVAGGATLAGGSLEPDFSNVLTLVSGRKYDYILACCSNDDAVAASATSNPGRLKTHISGLMSGKGAKLQQGIVGTTKALASAKAGPNQHNFGPMQYVFCQAGQSLPFEWAAAELGARMREESIDPAVNRIEVAYKATLYPPVDLVADALTEPELEDALQHGLTPIVYDSSSNPMPSRPITSYWKDSGGAADDRLLDTSRITGTFAVAEDLAVAIPREFKGAKLSEDLEPGDDPLPEGVVQERDVKSFVHGRVLFWVDRGVVIKAKYLEAYETGQFIVRVNPTDAAQCDIVLPIGIVPPLAKFSLVVNHVGPN